MSSCCNISKCFCRCISECFPSAILYFKKNCKKDFTPGLIVSFVFCRPPVVLGVTNPFFAKTLQHWPHIVRLGDTLDSKKIKVRKAGNLKTLDHKPG